MTYCGPKKNGGKYRPMYGNEEAAISAGMAYFADATLEACVESAKKDGEIFDSLLDEMGVVAMNIVEEKNNQA